MQKTHFAEGISWRSFVERKTKETFVLLNNVVTDICTSIALPKLLKVNV